jgi:hypothetical protein
MWTLARKAEILGNKSDPLAVGEEGLGRPGDAVRAAQEAFILRRSGREAAERDRADPELHEVRPLETDRTQEPR